MQKLRKFVWGGKKEEDTYLQQIYIVINEAEMLETYRSERPLPHDDDMKDLLKHQEARSIKKLL